MQFRPSRLIAMFAAALLACPAFAADPQPYSVNIGETGVPDLDKALTSSALLVSLRNKSPVAPFALVSRARDDIPRLEATLEGFGYYARKVTVTIEGRDVADPGLLNTLEALPQGRVAAVKVVVNQGQLYRLRNVALHGTALPHAAQSALALKSGQPAAAVDLLAAQGRVLTALQEDGYAFAKVSAPVATADDAMHVLDVSYNVDTGPRVQIGTISLKGLKAMDEDFVRGALTIHSGQLYQPSKIEAARQTLLTLGVFSSVSVHAAQHPSPGGLVPLEFDFTERPHRTVSLNGLYSTDLGLSVGATWSHRNLFGNAEQLNLSATATEIGGSAVGALGYNLTAQFIKPRFLEGDQALEFDVAAIKAALEAYDQTSESVTGLLRRKFSRLWSGTAGLTIMHDDVTQEGLTRLYQILAAPVTANYDSTGVANLTLDPLKGFRLSLAVTPTLALGSSELAFVVLQASGSTYFDLSGNGRSVLALRALGGVIEGGINTDLPPDQRLYAGGSATVRGFAYQTVGPLFPDGKPIGASSVTAGTVEFRQRVLDDWGAAAFFDVGQASATPAPFTGTLRAGAGVGARYYTPIGALRVDFAVPVTPIPHGDPFEVYIGIGQAF